MPKGVVELLGMRSTGDTPHNLDDNISGSLDFKTEYLLDRRAIRNFDPGALGAAGFYGTTVGPAPGFQWYLYGVQIQSGPVAVGATIQFGIGIKRQGPVNHCFYLPGMMTPLLAAGAWVQMGWQESEPIVMRAGDTFAVQVAVSSGAPAMPSLCWFDYAEVGV